MWANASIPIRLIIGEEPGFTWLNGLSGNLTLRVNTQGILLYLFMSLRYSSNGSRPTFFLRWFTPGSSSIGKGINFPSFFSICICVPNSCFWPLSMSILSSSMHNIFPEFHSIRRIWRAMENILWGCCYLHVVSQQIKLDWLWRQFALHRSSRSYREWTGSSKDLRNLVWQPSELSFVFPDHPIAGQLF